MDPRPPAARAVSLRKTYGSGDTAVHALDGITVELGKGSSRRSWARPVRGSRRSCTAWRVSTPPTSGSAVIGDTDLAHLRDGEITALRRDRLGFIFQSFNLVPTLTAEESITLPAKIAGGGVDKQWFEEVTGRFGIADRLDHRPAELSGGQQQRVACARAIVSRPEIFFGDEPTGNLDSNASHEVLAILRSAVDEMGQTVVIVTHDPTAAAWADRVLFLADGELVHELRDPDAEAILTVMTGFER